MNCPQCGHEARSEVMDRLAGLCPPCMAGFALEPPPEGAGPLKPGGTFHGLEILEEIGRGGMGVVYKARQPSLDRLVALKVLSPSFGADPEFIARFRAEARALASLNHPNVVQIHDFGEEAGLCFLVMELVPGVSLRRVMCGGRLDAPESLRIVTQVCAALEEAHKLGVVHRDIKPENILLDAAGRVKIADFGLAKLADGMPGPFTAPGVAFGTPQYMAPEQCEKRPTDGRTDVYAVGVVFYELLTGEVPRGVFEPPSRRASVDPRLDRVVLRALERDPERRWPTAAHLRREVERVVRPRDRWKIALVAAVIALVAAGAVLTVLAWPRDPFVPAMHDLAVGPYREGPWQVHEGRAALPARWTLRFRLRYEVARGDEPWIQLRVDDGGQAIWLFPEGGHEAALAELLGRGWRLMDKQALPPGKPAAGRWSNVEITCDGKRIEVLVDGDRGYYTDVARGDWSGRWWFAFGGVARGIEIRDVRLRDDK